MFTRIKTDQEIAAMRASGRILAEIHQLLRSKVEPGISTQELADCAAKEIKAAGASAAFLGYGEPTPFPDVICISINDEVVHGIPSRDRKLQSGDIVSLDLGVAYEGMITDAAITVPVGEVDEASLHLIKNTEKALFAGLKVVKHGVQVGDIGFAIQQVLERQSLGIVRDMVGHGVGHDVHEDPNIPNYGRRGQGARLVAGMTVAIEPMATLGNYGVYIDDDGWTVRTSDGSRSAQAEHTVLVTEKGCEILTQL